MLLLWPRLLDQVLHRAVGATSRYCNIPLKIFHQPRMGKDTCWTSDRTVLVSSWYPHICYSLQKHWSMVIISSASQPWKSCICSVPQLQQWNPQEKSDIIVVAFGSAPGVPNWLVLSSPLNIVPLLLVDKILEMCSLNPTSCLWCECNLRSKMTSRGLLQQPVVCCHHHRILC
jgi:hypothetical protein